MKKIGIGDLETQILSALQHIERLRLDVDISHELQVHVENEEEWMFGLACQGELLEISRNAKHFLVRYYATIADD